MDPIRIQDHPALDLLSQDQYREMTPGTTARTHEEKALAVSTAAISAGEHLNYLQKRANRAVQEAGSETSRENAWRQSVEQHRVEHHEKKQKLRRRRLVREADIIQDQEPMNISPFNSLPHFKYLDIAEAVETDVPPELFGFGSLGLAATGTKLLSGAFAESKPIEEAKQPHLPSATLEGIGPSKARSEKKDTYRSYVPQGNLLCIFMTCPIQERHCEGPYHHNSK